jgi:hypothetical protein
MRIFLLCSVVLLGFVGCGVIAPSGDEEAVVMKKPWFIGHGGSKYSSYKRRC